MEEQVIAVEIPGSIYDEIVEQDDSEVGAATFDMELAIQSLITGYFAKTFGIYPEVHVKETDS